MGLQDTSQKLFDLLQTLVHDLAKAAKGNKAASQRVRTGTIQLEKVGKKYRKESVLDEKKSPTKLLIAKNISKKPVRKKCRSSR